jgi:hypothetical protein
MYKCMHVTSMLYYVYPIYLRALRKLSLTDRGLKLHTNYMRYNIYA